MRPQCTTRQLGDALRDTEWPCCCGAEPFCVPQTKGKGCLINLAWVAGVWLAFWPTYEGASVTATLPGEPGGEVIRSSATAIEVNGLHVILLLLVPILLTAITLLGLRLQQTTMRKILLWSPAVVLLGFCFVAIFSIGVFYLPAALALLVAAIADLGGQEGNEPI